MIAQSIRSVMLAFDWNYKVLLDADFNSSLTEDWTLYPLGYVNFNFDAVVRDNFLVIIIVAQDSSGVILRIKANELTICEAFAMKLAIQVAIYSGWTNCIFEGDCLAVISELQQSNSSSNWQLVDCLEVIKPLLQRFHNWVVHKIPKVSN